MQLAPTLLSLLPLVVSELTIRKDQEQFDGECPKILPVIHFHLQIYLGRWFEQKRYGDLDTKCNRVRYKRYAGFPRAFRFVRRYEKITGSPIIEETGGLIPVSSKARNLARFKVTHNIEGERPRTTEKPDYIVLSTDYTGYTIVWSCVNDIWDLVPGGTYTTNLQTLRILTRSKFISSQLDRSIIEKVRSLGLDADRLKNVDQNNCKKKKQ